MESKFSVYTSIFNTWVVGVARAFSAANASEGTVITLVILYALYISRQF